MYMITGSPLRGLLLRRVKGFLSTCGLDWDDHVSFTAVLMDDNDIAATGSLDGSTIKCVAVSAAHQGEDLTARIMTVLFQEAAQQGREHLMLYTKPHNGHLFAPMGFHPVIRTPDCLLMENRGMAFSREQLLDKVWDYGYDGGTRTVDVHIQTLRAKLGDCGRMIETVRGIGYRFGGK